MNLSMKFIPTMVLRQLYNRGSLQNTGEGIKFSIKNRLSDTKLTKIHSIKVDDQQIDLKHVMLDFGNEDIRRATEVDEKNAINFPLRKSFTIYVACEELSLGKHTIEISFESSPFGKLKFDVDDAISEVHEHLVRIPRDEEDDFGQAAIKERQQFTEKYAGKELHHVKHYSFDPHVLSGNIEHFMGTAQIPLGIAGPLKVNGEHAQGEFLIPLATTEGTLVASYNRGCKVLNLSGGVKCTVVGDNMQRAPVFVFKDARGGRKFVNWVNANTHKIKEEAEATSSIARLKHIDYYLSNKFAYLRFNFLTGDAAGQNMVGRATFAACSWILEHYPQGEITNFYLESNLATDKKASQINIMRTRGKRVTAEATIKRDVLVQQMRVEPHKLNYHAGVSNIGSILSGANNNGCHSANAITAMFIATGQDVANVSESSAGVMYTELTPEGDLYMSITIPSLIVATYGGGTGLSTQRECLDIMDCYGKGKVRKFAEIVAGVVLAGEISLASAISSSDWVSSHEQYGRNR